MMLFQGVCLLCSDGVMWVGLNCTSSVRIIFHTALYPRPLDCKVGFLKDLFGLLCSFLNLIKTDRALYADTAHICHPTNSTMGDCLAGTEVPAGMVALLLSDDASKLDMASDLASYAQPSSKIS